MRAETGIAAVCLRALVALEPAPGRAHENTFVHREMGHTSVDILGSLSMVINLLPTSVLAKFAKDAASSVDLTVSNVRGAPFEVYIAGAKVEALYPMGPIAGTAFNLSMMSYAGMLDMGLVVDAGAVEAPAELRDAIESAYRDLLALP